RSGPGQHQAALGAVRSARPDLLTVDPPGVAVTGGARSQARQIRTGFGLGKTLTPDVSHLEDGGQEAALLLLGADRENDRARKLLADRIDTLRHRERADLLVCDQVLAQGSAVAAIGLRPDDAGKPG